MIYSVTLNPALDREYIVPDLIPNTVLRATEVHIDFGGKGFNVSRMLAALSTESTALGFVGGNTGQILIDGLEASGISTDFIRIAQETRTNTSIVEMKGDDHYKVNETGPVISPQETEALMEKIHRLLKAGDWWILSGSLPPGVKTNIYARIIELVNREKAKAVLDTSGEALRIGCESGPFLVKPNLEEAIQITSRKPENTMDTEAIIKAIHQFGVENIVLSTGKERSILSDGKKRWSINPPKITEENPTGAGDAMLAAIVYQLNAGSTMQEAFRWGIASGTAAARLPGTGMAAREEVEKLLEKVEIRED